MLRAHGTGAIRGAQVSGLIGVFRLSQNEDQQQAVVREIFSLLGKRSDAVCNFLEGGRYDGCRRF